MAGGNVQDEASVTRGPLTWIAVALHVAVGVIPYSASGLMAPPAGLAVLALIWLGLFVVLWRWRPRPAGLVLVIPVVAVAVWFAVMALGDTLFGWTA